MRVFKFTCDNQYWAFGAETKELAVAEFESQIGLSENIVIEEIPESEWDKKTINIWEDNNFNKKPFKVSIREELLGTEPQMIFTNDFSCF